MSEPTAARTMTDKYGNTISFIPILASSTELGGIKARARTDETKEVVIDPVTGKAYVDDKDSELREKVDNLDEIKASKDYVKEAIADAKLEGGNVDSSTFAHKSDIEELQNADATIQQDITKLKEHVDNVVSISLEEIDNIFKGDI